jgi:hypothetical protein
MIAELVCGIAVEAVGEGLLWLSKRMTAARLVAWWALSAGIVWGVTAWFFDEPASDARLRLAIAAWLAVPAMALTLTVMRAARSPEPHGGTPRIRAGSGAPRNRRLRGS